MKPNIPLFKVFMSPDVHQPLADVLASGYIGQGPKVDEFEKLLADYIGNPLVATVNSATSGLHLVLHMLRDNIASGRDEILTTPLSCTATNFPIVANGFKIKWVDIDPNTCNVDLVDLRRKISRKTAAIMVVHWGGYPVDLDILRDITLGCSSLYGYCPPVIEDCAHAFGSTYKGKLLGNHQNICVFSFQAIKNLTTCDGGLIVFPNKKMCERAKLLRWYGIDRTKKDEFRCEQKIMEWGFKFNLNDIAATIGIHNLAHIPVILEAHRSCAKYYQKNLVESEDAGVLHLEDKGDRESSYWMYTIRVERRDDFFLKMKEHGIMTSRVHERNDKHWCLREFIAPLPNLDIICEDMIAIPCGWWVTQENREYIVDCIKKGW